MARHKVISNKRKQKTKPDLLKDILQLLEMGMNMAVTFYLLLMIIVLPFYFTDGYAKIGTNKYEFFYKGKTYNLTYGKDEKGEYILFGQLYEGKRFYSYGELMNEAKIDNHFFREMLEDFE